MTSKLDSDNWESGSASNAPINLFSVLGFTQKFKYPSLLDALKAFNTGTTAGQNQAAQQTSQTPSTQTSTPTNASETAWITALLTVLGAPATTANINSLTSWIAKETKWNNSGPDGALYTNNPLNTTQQMPGATSINGVGVRKYASSSQGIQATFLTLTQNPVYAPIIAALKSGKGLCTGDASVSNALSTWSGGGYTNVCS